ncbi:hypothetical protein ACH5RR_009300 [Cinchona calisaya]|uniref:Myb/SANT-like domain-containing protein n=1 Tax=Cinchona calisaya TaxID=153742 RepID=A0ABD3AEK7_9GENT
MMPFEEIDNALGNVEFASGECKFAGLGKGASLKAKLLNRFCGTSFNWTADRSILLVVIHMALSEIGEMSEKRAHPDCRNALNPYHECSEHCFKRFAICRKASNPYHECSKYCSKIVDEVQKNIKLNDPGMTGTGKQPGSSQSIDLVVSDKNSGQYTRWNDKMDRLLGNVLIGQIARGNKCDIDTWKPQDLQAAVKFMKSILHLNVTKDDIKNRMELWKKYYTVVMDVKKQGGLTWDEDQKMIRVTSNETDKWASYVKSHPDADGMQNKVIKNWEDIVFLNGKYRASPKDAGTSNGGVEAIGGGENEVDLDATIRSLLQPSTSPNYEPNLQEEIRKDALVDALIDVATSIKTYFESKKKKEEIQQPSGTEIHETVSKLPGLTPYEVFKGVQKLINGNPEQFFLLKSLPDAEKEQWIKFLLLP